MATFIVKPVTDLIIGTNSNSKADVALVKSISDLSSSDTIDFGNNGYTDRLQFNAAGTITAAQLAGVSGIEQINLSSLGANVITLTDALVASSQNHKLVVIGGSQGNTINASAVAAGDVVDLRGGAKADTLTGGAGNDFLHGGGGKDTLTGGAGNDTIIVGNVVGDKISGGGGFDVLKLNAGGNIDLNTATSITGIDRVLVGSNDTTLHLTGANTTVNAGSAIGTVIIGGNGNDDITLGTAGQTILGGGGNDTVHATEATLFDGSNGSTLDGGSGYNTLAVTGGGTVDFSTFGFNNFSAITVDNASTILDLHTVTSTVAESLDITLGDGNNTVIEGSSDYTITGGSGNNTIDGGEGSNTIILESGNNTIDISSSETGSSVITSTGDDTVTMRASGQTAILGGGSDNVYIDVSGGVTIDSTINAGGGSGDVLHLVDEGDPTVTLGSGVLGFETIDMTDTGGIHLVTNAQAYNIIASNYGDTIDISSDQQSVVGGTACDTVNIAANKLDTNFKFDGGEGNDTINVTSSGTSTLGTGVQNVDQVNLYDDKDATGSTLTLTTQVDVSISGSSLADTINLGSSTGGTVCANDGNDTINLQSATGSALDHVTVYAGNNDDLIVMGTGTYVDIYGGDGNDTVQIGSQSQLIGSSNTLDGGEGTNTIELTASGTYTLVGSLVTNFSTVNIDNGAAVTLSLNDGVNYTVNMGDQAATNVTGGTGNETFNFGANGQTASGGDGNDTFNFNGHSGTAAGGQGNDTYSVSAANLGSVTITEGGEGGTDTVNITGGGTFTLNTTFANVENYSLDTASTVTIALTSTSNPDGYTLTGSTGDDTFKIGAGTGLETNSEQLYSGVTLDGNSHSAGDTIEITNAGIVDFTASGVTVENVENVVLDAATNIKLNDASYNVTGSAGVDTIDASAALAGHGQVINGGGGTDVITGGAGDDTITLSVTDQDTINAGTGEDTVLLTGAAGSTIVVDLTTGSDEFAGLTTNQSGFEDLNASALTGAGVDVTADVSTNVLIGSGQADTFRFGDGIAAGLVTVGGGGGSDTAVFSGTNSLIGVSSFTSIEALQLSGATAILTSDAAHLSGVTSISDAGVGAGQELHLTNSTNLSTVTVSGIESIILDNAATLIIDQSKISGLTTLTGSAGSDVLSAAAGNIDLTSIAMTAIETVSLSTGGSLTANSTDLANVTVINGSLAGNETLNVLDNTDISTIALNDVETLALGAGGVKLTVAQSQFGGATGVTTITGGSGSDELNATGNLDLTSIALTAVEKIDFKGTLTANSADLASVTAIAGSGTDTVLLLDSTNASAITFSGVTTLNYGGASQSVTVDGTKLGSIATITGNAASGDTLAAIAALDLTTIALTKVEAISFDTSGVGATLTVDKADLVGVTAITGGTGADTLAINDVNTTIDLSSITLSKVESISLGNGNNVLTVGDTTLTDVTSINQAGGTATLILTDASSHLDLTAITLDTEFTAITLGTGSDVSNNTLTIGNGSLTNVANVNGGGATDTIALVDSGTTLDLTSVALSSIEHITLGSGTDATSNTLTIGAADLSSLTAITGSTAVSDTIVYSDGTGTVDLVAHGATNIDTLTVNAGATGDITAVLAANNGLGMTLNVTLTDIDNGGSSITATGTAFADVFHFSAVTDSHTNDANDNAVSSITNFVSGSDHINLHDLALAGAAFGGNVAGLAGVNVALDATHDVVFNTSTQTLIIDLDHSGDFDSHLDLQIHLTGVASMSSGDFVF